MRIIHGHSGILSMHLAKRSAAAAAAAVGCAVAAHVTNSRRKFTKEMATAIVMQSKSFAMNYSQIHSNNVY